MTSEEAANIITSAGFTEYDIFEPSKDTRGQWVIRVKTEKRGWKYLRMAGDVSDAAEQLSAFASRLP